jgi:tetratricopeptide (TPR) repeat protein
MTREAARQAPVDPQELERSGQWADAARVYRQLCETAIRRGKVPDLLRGLNATARMLQMQQCWDEAEEAALLSWTIAERNDLEQQSVRAMNILALIRCSQEDIADAAHLWQAALGEARSIGDQLMVGMICQNLGVVANIHGDLREARLLYLECIAASIGADNEPAAMAAYNNLGMVCVDLEEWMEAEIYFARGIEIAEQLGDTATLVRLYENRAEPLIYVGEFARAEAALKQAERLAPEIGDVRAQSDVERFRGRMARLQGEYGRAEQHLERALKIAREADLDLETGEVLEEQARLRWANGRHGAARVLLREARRAYQAVGAARDLTRLARLMEEWTVPLPDA